MVYLLTWGVRRPVTFVGHMILAGAVSVAAFVITTPYALLDSPGFWRDMSLLLNEEGPHFKTPLPFLDYLGKVWTDCLGFFSPQGLYLLAGIALAGCAMCTVGAQGASRRAPKWISVWVTEVFRIEVLLVGLLGVFLLMNYSIGIFQSRYSIPGAVVFLVISLIGWYVLAGSLRQWRRISVGAHLIVVPPLLFVSGLNAYVHVEVFSHSAKKVAATEVRKLLTADSDTRIGVVAYPDRSPFEPQAAQGRLDVFLTMVADYDVDLWNEYLQIIAAYFNARGSKIHRS